MKDNTQSEFPELSKAHLATLRKLHQKKFRRIEKLVLVEGWNLIEQLIANGYKPVEVITTLPPVVKFTFPTMGCPIYHAEEHELEILSETDFPQSLVAVYRIPEVGLSKKNKLLLFLDGIQDPGNLGTIFRIATAFKVDGIVLSYECCEVFLPKVVRASMGSVFWMPTLVADDEWLMEQKAEKIGLIANSKVSLRDVKIDQDKPVIVVIGSESNGISEVVRVELTQEVFIPMSGLMESLNAGVATGIAAYEISQRLFLLT